MSDKSMIQEIERELQLAEMMAKDLKKLWKSYARKALIAKQEAVKKEPTSSANEISSSNKIFTPLL